MSFEIDGKANSGVVTNIKVIGVGGGGGNAINRMVESKISGAELIAVNTDNQALCASRADDKIQIGVETTKGQGAGGTPEEGSKAAEENREEIVNALDGADMLFITAGMGGGTGTGAAPVIAKLSKERNILTVGVVTRPFDFEGEIRAEIAQQGIEELAKNVDSLIVIPNEKLNELPEYEDLPLIESFHMADDVLATAVKNISGLITEVGYINLDFADIKKIMKDAGIAHMGFATATGKDKVISAAKQAAESPLLETSINGAQKIILSYKTSADVSTKAIKEATNYIKELAAPRAHIIVGVTFDDKLSDTVELTLIAADFISSNKKVEEDVKSKIETESESLYDQYKDSSKSETSYSAPETASYTDPAVNYSAYDNADEPSYNDYEANDEPEYEPSQEHTESSDNFEMILDSFGETNRYAKKKEDIE